MGHFLRGSCGGSAAARKFSSPSSPADLVERLGRGDRVAEEEFARLYRHRVVRMMRARMPHEIAAEDLAQDVMVESLKALRRGAIAAPEKLGAFVRGTARNVLNSHLRSRRRRPKEVAFTVEMPDTRSPEAAVQRLEVLDLARRAMNGLTPRDRELVRMSLIEDRTPAEIAVALGSSGDLIRARKCRALKKLLRGFRILSRRGVSRMPAIASSRSRS
ncbi:MAG: sigma-70 family RNA polymerase sigma factor [Acidobacteria bacterium]|nr:sigma-70 family RNA polymerase sigma factor [Acidobacteriota bacterium]